MSEAENANEPRVTPGATPEIREMLDRLRADAGSGLVNTDPPEVEEIDPKVQKILAQMPGSDEIMTMAVRKTTDIFCPNWNISGEEVASLGSIYGLLFDKYVPEDALAKYGIEAAAAGATLMIFGPRLLSGEPPKIITVTDTEDDETEEGDSDEG